MASTQMQVGHLAVSGMQRPADHATVTAELPCHQQHSGDVSEAAQLTEATPDSGPVKSKSKSASPDCCKSGACRCACVSQAQAAIPVYFVGDALIEHADAMRVLKPGRVAPALRHLIRPPIG